MKRIVDKWASYTWRNPWYSSLLFGLAIAVAVFGALGVVLLISKGTY